MSKIIPFPALIPDAAIVSHVVCPPYDVLTSAQARDLAVGNKYSLLHITKAEIDLPESVPEYDDRVYEKAKENLAIFQKNKWLIRDAASIYAYRTIRGDHIQTGIVCGVSVDDYDAGLIKRHEKTKKDKEDDRYKLALTLNTHAEPVFLAFRSNPEIKKLIAETTKTPPLFEVKDRDAVSHIMWRIPSPEQMVSAFAKLSAIYIADGHHRSNTASRIRAALKEKNPAIKPTDPCNFFPAVVFPEDETRVYRYDWDGEEDKRPVADVTMKDIMDLADKNGIMPPKSTWFAPKLISGLFVYTL